MIRPWALTWDDDNDDMIAFDSESEKVKRHRADKMLKVQVTEENRDGAELFSRF